MTVQGLRELTNKAIEDGKKEHALKLEQEAKILKMKEQEQIAKSFRVIEKIPERANFAASKGENWVIVMNLKNEEYTFEKNKVAISPDITGLAARTVFKHCEDAGFNVALENWEYAQEMDGNYNIVIRW
jgi:hypothetical protein